MAFEGDGLRRSHALLPIGPDIHPLPEEVFDEDVVILGRKGMGKTFAGMGMVAHLVRTGRQVLVIDPLSVWWGLKYSRDLTQPGLPLIHFGDEDADVPINGNVGEAIARLMLAQGYSAIVEVGHLLPDEQIPFMYALLGTLFRRKRKQTDPLWLVLEEADEFCPQNAGVMRPVLEQIRRIARQGRVRGFRVFSITQRTATVNKNLVTQASSLVSFQVVAPQDTRVLEAWLDHYGDAEGRAQVRDTVKQLGIGEAWVWCPKARFLQRVRFPENSTYDSTKTPAAKISTTAPPPISPEVINEISEKMARFMGGGDLYDEPPTRGREPASAPCRSPFGPAIKAARKRAKLTQRQLAQRMVTDAANIARLEAGRGNPSFRTLDRVAQATEQELLIAYRFRPPLEGGKLK
jgi:hypothetical protein